MARFVPGIAVALLVVTAWVGGGPVAEGQEPDAQRTAAARALFNEGLAFVEQHDWPQAVDRFRRVLALRESAAVRLNLGLALAQTGKLVEAGELLRHAAQDHTATETIRHQATRAATDADARVGRLTIRVDAPQATDEVTCDGTAVPTATLGVAVPADPGAHVVVLLRAGHSVATENVTVAEGAAAEVTLTATLAVAATEVVPPPPAPVDATHEPALYERWWFWAAVGGAVVVVTLIAVIAVAASGSPAPVTGNFDPGVLNVAVSP